MPAEKPSEPTSVVKVDDITGDTEVLARKAEVTQQYFNDERGRTRTIENKASMFITSSGFLGTVLIGTANILVGQNGNISWLKVFMVVCLLFFAIYMVGTILSALKALKRTRYSRPDPATVMDIVEKNDFNKQAIADLVNSTAYNQDSTNQKMDYVVLAQRYYWRLMFSVLVFIVLLLIYVLQQNGVSFIKWLSLLNEEISSWTLSTWYVIVSSLLLLISLIFSVTALVKVSKLRKVNRE